MERAQAYGIDLPRNRCEECGYWFTTPDDDPICPDCLESEQEEGR